MIADHNKAGVYKTIDDVPHHHRIRTHTDRYQGRDMWREYDLAVASVHPDERNYSPSERSKWENHMQRRGRHYAVAEPDDVTAWTEFVREDIAEATRVNYTKRIFRFYRWLMWHTDHPHRYNPFVLAANTHDPTAELLAKFTGPDRHNP